MISKEDAFDELLNYVKIIENNPHYRGWVFYFRDKKHYFQYNHANPIFWVNYEFVWKVFEEKYKMNDEYITLFIKEKIEKKFNLKEIKVVTEKRINAARDRWNLENLLIL